MIVYLDEDLHGPRFADILRAAAIEVRTCGEEGFSGVADEIWIPAVAARDWVIVSGDHNTRFEAVERSAIIASNAKFVLLPRSRRTSHPELAQNFVNTFPLLRRFADGRPGPWLVSVTRPNRVSDIAAGRPGNVNVRQLDFAAQGRQ